MRYLIKNTDEAGCKYCGEVHPYFTSHCTFVEFDKDILAFYDGFGFDLVELSGMDATVTVRVSNECIRVNRVGRTGYAGPSGQRASFSFSGECSLQ